MTNGTNPTKLKVSIASRDGFLWLITTYSVFKIVSQLLLLIWSVTTLFSSFNVQSCRYLYLVHCMCNPATFFNPFMKHKRSIAKDKENSLYSLIRGADDYWSFFLIIWIIQWKTWTGNVRSGSLHGGETAIVEWSDIQWSRTTLHLLEVSRLCVRIVLSPISPYPDSFHHKSFVLLLIHSFILTVVLLSNAICLLWTNIYPLMQTLRILFFTVPAKSFWWTLRLLCDQPTTRFVLLSMPRKRNDCAELAMFFS